MKDQLRDRSGNTLANLVFYFSTDPTLKESKTPLLRGYMLKTSKQKQYALLHKKAMSL